MPIEPKGKPRLRCRSRGCLPENRLLSVANSNAANARAKRRVNHFLHDVALRRNDGCRRNNADSETAAPVTMAMMIMHMRGSGGRDQSGSADRNGGARACGTWRVLLWGHGMCFPSMGRRRPAKGSKGAVAAPGAQILVAIPDNGYEMSSGTSYSAAEVTGIVALMLQRKPALTPDQVRGILRARARDLGPKGPDVMYGAGLANAWCANGGNSAGRLRFPSHRACERRREMNNSPCLPALCGHDKTNGCDRDVLRPPLRKDNLDRQ